MTEQDDALDEDDYDDEDDDDDDDVSFKSEEIVDQFEKAMDMLRHHSHGFNLESWQPPNDQWFWRQNDLLPNEPTENKPTDNKPESKPDSKPANKKYREDHEPTEPPENAGKKK